MDQLYDEYDDLIAFAGALFVSVCVYAMAMRDSWFEPVKLTLAGAAMGLCLFDHVGLNTD